MSIQDLVSKSLDTIRQEMFDQLTAKQEEYVAAGWLPIRLNLNKGIVRGLIELWCWGLWQLYQFLALVLAQVFPDSATGLWLDLHCKQVAVLRKPATKASGMVYLTRAVIGGNVMIPAGRVFKTKPDGSGAVWRFVSTADAVLPDGALEVAVPVIAEEYGAGANATAGQISEIVTVIPGVDAVENRAGWLTSEGSDAELNEPLRLRYKLAWQVLSGCTRYAYEAWAREVTGVAGVAILDQHPRGQGTIDVVISGSAGVPTEALVNAVTANILGTGAGDEKQPINDDVQIRGVAAVNVAISVELEISSGIPADIMTLAEIRLRSLFVTQPPVAGITQLAPGQDPTRDRLGAVMMLPGVKRLNWTSPADNLAVPADGLAVLESLALTYVLAAE